MLRPLLATVFVAALAAPALAADYAVDPNHTQATFTVTHLAISRVSGKVPVTAGSVAIGANGIPSAISVTFSAKDIDTQSADRDRDLRGADWFEVDKYPTMTFVSKSVSGTPQAFTVQGDLTMHGVTKPVTLNVEFGGLIKDPWGNQRAAFTATGTLNRKDFGLTWNKALETGSLMVGEDVKIILEIEAAEKK